MFRDTLLETLIVLLHYREAMSMEEDDILMENGFLILLLQMEQLFTVIINPQLPMKGFHSMIMERFTIQERHEHLNVMQIMNLSKLIRGDHPNHLA